MIWYKFVPWWAIVFSRFVKTKSRSIQKSFNNLILRLWKLKKPNIPIYKKAIIKNLIKLKWILNHEDHKTSLGYGT